jgi:hypothetical protein
MVVCIGRKRTWSRFHSILRCRLVDHAFRNKFSLFAQTNHAERMVKTHHRMCRFGVYFEALLKAHNGLNA